MDDKFEEAAKKVTKIHKILFAKTAILINLIKKIIYGTRSAV